MQSSRQERNQRRQQQIAEAEETTVQQQIAQVGDRLASIERTNELLVRDIRIIANAVLGQRPTPIAAVGEVSASQSVTATVFSGRNPAVSV